MLRIDPAGPSGRQAQPQVSVVPLGLALCHPRRWSTVRAHRLRSSTALSHERAKTYLDPDILLRTLGAMVPPRQRADNDRAPHLHGACSAADEEV